MAGLLPRGGFHLESVYCAISYTNTWQNITWATYTILRHLYGARGVQNMAIFGSKSKDFGTRVMGWWPHLENVFMSHITSHYMQGITWGCLWPFRAPLWCRKGPKYGYFWVKLNYYCRLVMGWRPQLNWLILLAKEAPVEFTTWHANLFFLMAGLEQCPWLSSIDTCDKMPLKKARGSLFMWWPCDEICYGSTNDFDSKIALLWTLPAP